MQGQWGTKKLLAKVKQNSCHDDDESKYCRAKISEIKHDTTCWIKTDQAPLVKGITSYEVKPANADTYRKSNMPRMTSHNNPPTSNGSHEM